MVEIKSDGSGFKKGQKERERRDEYK